MMKLTKIYTCKSAVDELRARQTQHRAEISKIEDRIKSMLCLEHKEAA